MTVTPPPGRPPAPCRGARWLLAGLVALSLFVGTAILADGRLRAGRQELPAAAWVQALHLSGPALGEAGTPLRHPETVHPAVDLRFLPGLGEWP